MAYKATQLKHRYDLVRGTPRLKLVGSHSNRHVGFLSKGRAHYLSPAHRQGIDNKPNLRSPAPRDEPHECFDRHDVVDREVTFEEVTQTTFE